MSFGFKVKSKDGGISCPKRVQYPSKKRTQSSSFGVSNREGHDSSKYYNSRLYENVPKESDVGVFPENLKNQLICQDARNMSQIPSNSVHHMITSPSIQRFKGI